MAVAYEWRGPFTSDELNVLHAQGFEHDLLDWDWRHQVERHSLGWVTARDDEGLAGLRQRRLGRRQPRVRDRHPGRHAGLIKL